MKNRLRPTGFNFTEVLFAVFILGIGFIMTAAIFPVALMQTKQTQEESAGSALARGGANYLEQIALDYPTPGNDATNIPRLPATGNQVRVVTTPAIKNGLLLSSDGRFGWIPLYRRSGTPLVSTWTPPLSAADVNDWSNIAHVYMVPIAVRNRSTFDKGTPSLIYGPNGVASMVATIADSTWAGATPANTDEVDYIQFDAGKGENDTNDNYTAVAAGSYVVLANATFGTVPGERARVARVGNIFRIGNPAAVQPPGTVYPRRWELVPGNDYVPLKGDWGGGPGDKPDGDFNDAEEIPGPLWIPDAEVIVIGKDLLDPSATYNAASNPRDGNPLDIGIYTTFVNVR